MMRAGQQDVEQVRVVSTQKLPMVAELVRLMPRIERHGDHDAHSGREEVVRRQAGHLGEIAHRGSRACRLPVGVGGEAGGGVPCQVGPDGGADACGFHGRHSLQAFDARR